MSSLSRFPRLALACLLAALAAGGLLLLLKATDQPVAAGPVPLAPMAPTQFPPAGRDCAETDAHMIVDLGQGPVPIPLTGSLSVARSAPYSDPAGGGDRIDTEMVALTLRGHMPDWTPVAVTLQSALPSTGFIQEQVPGGTYPADSFFDVFVEIDTGGPVGAVFNQDPLRMEAVIHSIPPISATYETGPVSVFLWDATGAVVGEVIQFQFHPTVERACWFWKAGGWEDYAPSGLPDFDQKQDGWGFEVPGMPWQWTFCGPVAAANSLWWLDSKLEPFPAPPTVTNDHFPLVQSYEPWDDHWISNTVPLVNELAGLFRTDPASGTDVRNMEQGIRDYIAGKGLAEDFTVTLEPQPTFDWVTEEVTRSEDVILLLGFWECVEWEGEDCIGWVRLGGHFVTVAGVDPIGRYIALSDPFFDRAEMGEPGRVLSGTLIPHTLPPQPHPSYLHDDAGNVSHDIYRTVETFGPGGMWGPAGYAESADDIQNFLKQNFTEAQLPWAGEPKGNPIVVEVEYALATSPVSPDAWVIKTTEETDARWNGLITYTITYGNGGGITALDARIVDFLPGDVTYVDSTPGGFHAGGVVTWTFPAVAPHSATPLTVTALVSVGLPIGDPLTNTVYLYLGTAVWDWDDVTSHITGTQLFVPVVLRNATGG